MAEEKQPGRRAPLGVVETSKNSDKTVEDNLGAYTADANAEAAKAAITEQLEILKAEVAQLRDTLGLIAENTGQYAVSRVNSVREEVRVAVAANPLGALFGAALVGYLFGLRRR